MADHSLFALQCIAVHCGHERNIPFPIPFLTTTILTTDPLNKVQWLPWPWERTVELQDRVAVRSMLGMLQPPFQVLDRFVSAVALYF